MMVLFSVRATLLKTGACCCAARCRNTAQHWCSPPQALADHSFIRTLGPPSPLKKIQRKKTNPKQR